MKTLQLSNSTDAQMSRPTLNVESVNEAIVSLEKEKYDWLLISSQFYGNIDMLVTWLIDHPNNRPKEIYWMSGGDKTITPLAEISFMKEIGKIYKISQNKVGGFYNLAVLKTN